MDMRASGLSLRLVFEILGRCGTTLLLVRLLYGRGRVGATRP